MVVPSIMWEAEAERLGAFAAQQVQDCVSLKKTKKEGMEGGRVRGGRSLWGHRGFGLFCWEL